MRIPVIEYCSVDHSEAGRDDRCADQITSNIAAGIPDIKDGPYGCQNRYDDDGRQADRLEQYR